MKERPILFSASMVRAILEGRKTQTRRVIKPQPIDSGIEFRGRDKVLCGWPDDYGSDGDTFGCWQPGGRFVRSPYGGPGDWLWVRETWAETDRGGGTPVVTYAAGGCIAVGRGPQRRAEDFLCAGIAWPDTPGPDRWRRSIHMPRWASRITLEITDVRVQRVQEISETDAIAEGITDPATIQEFPAGVGTGETVVEYCRRSGWLQREFMMLWDSINAKRGFGWDTNPWVWALTFKHMEQA